VTIAFSAIGFLFVFLREYFFEVKFSKLAKSIAVFVITTLSVLLLFPKVSKFLLEKLALAISLKMWDELVNKNVKFVFDSI